MGSQFKVLPTLEWYVTDILLRVFLPALKALPVITPGPLDGPKKRGKWVKPKLQR